MEGVSQACADFLPPAGDTSLTAKAGRINVKSADWWCRMFERYRQTRRWTAARPVVVLRRTIEPAATDWRFAWLPHGEGSPITASAMLALPVVALTIELLRLTAIW